MRSDMFVYGNGRPDPAPVTGKSVTVSVSPTRRTGADSLPNGAAGGVILGRNSIREGCLMRRGLFVLIALAGLALAGPAQALESGETCDIEDDAVQPDVLEDLERILKELRTPSS